MDFLQDVFSQIVKLVVEVDCRDSARFGFISVPTAAGLKNVLYDLIMLPTLLIYS